MKKDIYKKKTIFPNVCLYLITHSPLLACIFIHMLGVYIVGWVPMWVWESFGWIINVFVQNAFVSEPQMNEAKHCFAEDRRMNVNRKGAAEKRKKAISI